MSKRFPFTLIQLSYFVECAKVLNMTEAAQKLHVAQSAISAAIAHLESHINSELFIRQHSKGLVLTRAGEQLLEDSQRIFAQLSETVETIGDRENLVRGTLRLACFNALEPFVLPTLLSRIRSRYPGLKIESHDGTFLENMQDLRQGKVDLALTYDLDEYEGIQKEPLRSEPPYALVSFLHPLAHSAHVQLSDFATDDFVLLNLAHHDDFFLDLLTQAGLANKIAYRTTNFETARSLVARGLGVAMLNQRPGTDLTYSGSRVVSLPLRDPLPEFRIVLATRIRSPLSARAKAVRNEIRGLLSPRGEIQSVPRT